MIGIKISLMNTKLKKRGGDNKMNIKHSGLCSTCNNAPGCAFIADPQRPRLQCEEFDNYTVVKKELIENSVLSKIDKKDEEEYTGICSNCLDLKVCTFPKPEGGIWHCEEYR